MKQLFTIFVLFFLFGCQTKIEKDNLTLFTNVDSDHSHINFVNKVINQKDFNIFTYRNFYNGGGVAIGDINNDSLPDIFFTANQHTNKLYLNKGNLQFEDITSQSNVSGGNTWSTGVVMVDINNDGFLDIYVCNAGNLEGNNLENELFINNGDLTFTEKAKEYNLNEKGLTTHAAFFDYDNDGDLDVYILNNSFIPVSSLNYTNKRDLRDHDWQVPNALKGGGDKLLENDNGKYIDVSEKSGIYGSLIGFGLGVTVGDINQDSYLDIYVSNDFYERDYLYINNQDGTFKESIQKWTTHMSQSSMGADMADINNDANPDVFVTDMLPKGDSRIKETTNFEGFNIYNRKLALEFGHQFMQNSLQLNTNTGKLMEIANFSGVARSDWSWGALLFDMDNDGFKDIFVCNGIYHDLTNQDFMNFFANDVVQKMVLSGKKEDVNDVINQMPSTPITNYAFKNNGNLTFDDYSIAWGFDAKTFSNGAAYADLDNDGDLDLVINNVNQKAQLYRNNADLLYSNFYIKVKLKGLFPNAFGIGSKIKIFSNNEIIYSEIIPSRGFQSSVDYVQTIGIGKRKIDSLIVVWPSKKVSIIHNVSPNSFVTIKEKNGLFQKEQVKNDTNVTYFTQLDSSFEKHVENNYIDYDYEGLIYQMLSREGPTISSFDINKDGLDDVFIGGAKNNPGIIYLQNSKGGFDNTFQPDLMHDNLFEDTSSAFFDVDQDGDIDLMVGSGGNEVNDIKYLETRLYLNDGSGLFHQSAENIPTVFHNNSIIAPNDFDGDGDVDVFIGHRSVPSLYGVNAKHQLLENDGNGIFKDVTNKYAYSFRNLGMVTDAVWEDFDGDNVKDLVIIQDWGTPMIFKNNRDNLVYYETNLTKWSGWWNAVKIADVNNDKLPDIILGNVGLNFPYNPNDSSLLKMFVNDFDDNSTIEQIVTQTIEGLDKPIFTKHDITKQIVSLKKQNLKFSDYANKSINDLFSKDIIDNSIVRKVNISASIILINNGNRIFTKKTLPDQIQFSSVEAIEVVDINNDSNVDLIMGGNRYFLKPQFSRLDASYGSVLIGNGKGDFRCVDNTLSGFEVEGEVRSFDIIQSKKYTMLIVGINNNKPKLFRLNVKR